MGEAILSTNYILNKVSRKKVNQTPYELWYGRVPSYKYLKVWGCLAKAGIPSPKKTKICPKTIDCIFIGNAKNNSAYRFLIHKSEHTEMHVNTIIESRNAFFFNMYFQIRLDKRLVTIKDLMMLLLVRIKNKIKNKSKS